MSSMVTIRISNGCISSLGEINCVYQKTLRCLFSATGSPVLEIDYFCYHGRRPKELVT